MISITKAINIGNERIKLISIKNKNELEVKLLNYGAAIVELLMPDRNGIVENIVLSYENLNDYIINTPYFGVTVGRTAGRIADGYFVLDGKGYKLNKNYGANHGHGGPKGFSHQIWDYTVIEKENSSCVQFEYYSKNLEENYPGNLEVKVSYTLTNDNRLIIEYEAECDKKTICNLTNHSYFNLSGNYKRKITEQYLRIKSNHYLELNRNLIPTGRFIKTKNTPMDFNSTKLIGRDINSDYEQLTMTNGYDHTWMLNDNEEQIELYDELSGRKMVVTTTYPGVVVYTYNFPNNERLKYGKIGAKHGGICFETQYEPNGINSEFLNSAILDKGEKYYEKTELKLEVR